MLAPLVSLADKIKNNKLTLPIFSIVYFVKPKFSKSNGKEIEIAHSTNLRELKKEFFLLVNNKKDIQLAFSKIYLKNQKTNEVLLEYNPEQDAIIFYENENIKKVLNIKENKFINEVTEEKEDLINDLVSIITSFCARIYGQRRTKRKTESLIKELEEEKNRKCGK